MKTPGRPARISRRKNLLNLVSAEFHNGPRAYELFAEFLQQKTFDRGFCLRLFAVAKQRTKIHWELRRLAVLMLEHQILRLHPDNLDDFDFLFTQLHLKQPGVEQSVVESVLREGYTTIELRDFILEFQRKLARLNHVHRRISGLRTRDAALRDFIKISRHDCRLSLARYLFTPEDVVDQILRQLHISGGVRDSDDSSPRFIDEELTRALRFLPGFEAGILKQLCETSYIYWVSDTTSSEINSLVEYPATTVVLVIKPPGSDIEFEFKRAGRRGPNLLNVVYARDGYTVPPSHRLDGGSMQWLLQYEANAASRLAHIYRLVHDTEAPIPNYVSRSTIYSVPAWQTDVQTIPYFTEARLFGPRFSEMRAAMTQSVSAFREETGADLADLPGDLGLTAQFLGQVTPAQAVLSGTSSFRLDRLAVYLSADGPEVYFKEGLTVEYSKHDARRFADELLEEVLAVYRAPQVEYQDHEQYLTAAFRIAENRTQADQIYLSLLQQIAKFWGTLLAVRGYTQGESFVARNVGLKSFWEQGQWKVKIIFMDHDAVVIPGRRERNFYAYGALRNMAFDERHIWGRSSPELFATSEVGCLNKIYRVSGDLQVRGQAVAKAALKDAYQKTQHRLLTDPGARKLFSEEFIERLPDWDTLVRGYFQMNGNMSAATWKKQMRKELPPKRYKPSQFDSFLEVIERNKGFLERNSFLFSNGENSRHRETPLPGPQLNDASAPEEPDVYRHGNKSHDLRSSGA